MKDLEFQVVEKETKLKENSIELERTQKSMKMLNSSTSKLDHILALVKSSKDHKGLGFKGELFG